MRGCTLPLVVLLASLTHAPTLAQLQTTRVIGMVVDAQGAAVPGATVSLADPLGGELRTAVTDAAGRFELTAVPPGRFVLQATAASGATARMPIGVEAALPLDVTVRLPPAIAESISVTAVRETPSTMASIAGNSLAAVPTRVRGRSLQDAVATLPGWGTEDNGLLHAHGVDDGFLYVIDGIPVYERLDALNGVAPDVPTITSLNVLTGYVPPEFGYKAGGVIEVRSGEAVDGWRFTGDIGAGSNDSVDGGLVMGGTLTRGMDVRLGGSAQRTERFLDPVHPDNLHNQGSAGSTFGHAALQTGNLGRVRFGFGLGRSSYDVPNTEEQAEAAQDQRQRLALGSLDVSWQRAWSDSTVSHLTVYHRRSSAALLGSAADTPVFAESDRSLERTGALASLTHQRGAHVLKAGLEAQVLSLDEAFGFFVTDAEHADEAGLSEAALVYDADSPFGFADRASPSLWSIYFQDSWQAGSALTLGAGVRVDRSTLLLDRYQWSPRAGVSYRIGDATVVRGSVSRFFQPPQPEYLLLSSSEEARVLSPFEETGDGGADVEPERQWAFEAGVGREFRRWRLDATYWRRAVREAADPNVFFGTTVIFPNAVARGRADGVDLRLEVPRWGAWSAYAGASFGRVVQTGPITGGLFLEDEVGEIGPGDEFTPDHDQRAVLAAGLLWDHARSGVSVSLAARYESGTPIQRDDDDSAELMGRPGASLVDFDRGRVKPRTLASVVASIPLAGDRVQLRASVLNLFDERYAYNFGNPFSGTHFGAPRTFSLSLQVSSR